MLIWLNKSNNIEACCVGHFALKALEMTRPFPLLYKFNNVFFFSVLQKYVGLKEIKEALNRCHFIIQCKDVCTI